MAACTERYDMIYEHKEFKLEIKKYTGKFYYLDRLIFQGNAFKAMKMFINYCDNENVNHKFKPQLAMREKCTFKQEEKND